MRCAVVGVGCIGRQVGMQLACMGYPLVLIDFDKVEKKNVFTQGYRECDIGKQKVFALKEQIRDVLPNAFVVAIPERFSPKDVVNHKVDAVFVCVDNSATRRYIYSESAKDVKWIIDGRMDWMSYRVCGCKCDNPESLARYFATLMDLKDDKETEPDDCTIRSLLFTGYHVASNMLAMFYRLKDIPDLVCDNVAGNLLTGEYIIR